MRGAGSTPTPCSLSLGLTSLVLPLSPLEQPLPPVLRAGKKKTIVSHPHRPQSPSPPQLATGALLLRPSPCTLAITSPHAPPSRPGADPSWTTVQMCPGHPHCWRSLQPPHRGLPELTQHRERPEEPWAGSGGSGGGTGSRTPHRWTEPRLVMGHKKKRLLETFLCSPSPLLPQRLLRTHVRTVHCSPDTAQPCWGAGGSGRGHLHLWPEPLLCDYAFVITGSPFLSRAVSSHVGLWTSD